MALEPQKAGLAALTLKTGFEFTVLTLPYPLNILFLKDVTYTVYVLGAIRYASALIWVYGL